MLGGKQLGCTVAALCRFFASDLVQIPTEATMPSYYLHQSVDDAASLSLYPSYKVRQNGTNSALIISVTASGARAIVPRPVSARFPASHRSRPSLLRSHPSG